MAENNNQGDSQRTPRDLRGLLQFCTEVTAAEDRTQNALAIQLSPERREFLEKVLSGLQGDTIKCMAECLQKLTDHCVNNVEEDVTAQEEALDTIADLVEDLNYAIDLDKLNGFPVMVNCLSSPHPSLQSRAAEVIGNVCQNNEICQKSIYDLDVMPLLLNMIDTHSDMECKSKALYAVSCFARNFEPAEISFVENSGFSHLMRAIQIQNQKLTTKCTFLLTHFIEKDKKYREMLLSMGFVEQFVSILFNEDIDDILREFCTESLYKLASEFKQARAECSRPEFHLVSQLREREPLAKKAGFNEEVKYINLLLELLHKDDVEEEELEENTLR